MQIDPASARALQAVVDHDLVAIRRLNDRLEAFDLVTWNVEQRDSAAYQLHNIYNALENSFMQISRTFENHITQPERWHRELLDKMFLDLHPLRPALLPQAVRPLLRDLLSFRHLFRHGYEFDLDAAKLARLVREWRDGREPVLDALRAFSVALSQIVSPAD